MNTSKIRILPRALVVSSAALGLLLSAGHAHALDGKVYPGAMCMPSSSNTFVSRDNTSGSLTVDYPTTLWCPILGDSEATTTAGLDIVRVNIWEGATSGTHTSCNVFSYTSSGVLFDSNTATAKTFSAFQSLNLPLTKTGGPVHPRYLLKCVLAGPGTLNEYEIEEK